MNFLASVKEDKDIEEELLEMEVSCELCKKELKQSTILKHIVQNKACKFHYGPQRFQKMKKEKEKLRKKHYRQSLSSNTKKKIINSQREYDQKTERKQKRKEIREAKKAKATEEALEKRRVWEEKRKMEEKDDEIKENQCESCKRIFASNSILKHIGIQKSCRSFYGPKFSEMKRENNKKKLQKYRDKYGTGEELDRQIESYSSNPKVKERKKEYYTKNKEHIKKREKEKYDKILAEKRAKVDKQCYDRAQPNLIRYQKGLDDKLRLKNSTGTVVATSVLTRYYEKSENQMLLCENLELIKTLYFI